MNERANSNLKSTFLSAAAIIRFRPFRHKPAGHSLTTNEQVLKDLPKARKGTQSFSKSETRSLDSQSLSEDWRKITRPIEARRLKLRSNREELRAKFLEVDHETISEIELLELLLLNLDVRANVRPLSERLLAEFGDLNGVITASKSRILKIEGATTKTFLWLRLTQAFAQRMAKSKLLNCDVLSSWSDVITYCRVSLAHQDTEQFRILFLNQKNVLIADEKQALGTVNHVPVYPREVAKRALELNASSVILIHNHPSGDPSPSVSDIDMTDQVEFACKAVGVATIDHIVVGKETEFSFRAMGYLPS